MDFHKGKMLIVDDEPVMIDILSRYVAMKGWEPFTCSTVAEAKEILASGQISKAIIDWNLIGGTGDEVIAAAFKAGLTAKDLCVMTGTGISSEELTGNLAEAKRLAPEAVLLAKPFSLKQQALNDWLQN